MFFLYLRRELHRRMRQAILISLGLAVGVGLVITVAAASDGVRGAQGTVLHALYGVGTDITVTQPPKPGSGDSTSFGFRQQIRSVRSGQLAAGTSVNINDLVNAGLGTLNASAVGTVARQRDVAAAVGGLALTDVTVTGTVPALNAGSGTFSSNFTTRSFTADGVDLSHPALGPLSSAHLTAGRTLTSADASSNDAVLDADYAAQQNLKVNSTVSVGGTNFRVIGIVRAPQGGTPPDVYLPLASAQSIGKTGSASLADQVNTLYVSATSAADIPAVQAEISKVLPSATVADASDLASEVTGSLASATSLVSNLGTWLSAAVLIAAFLVASLLTMTAVARRVREFGTLKALGWRSRRIVGQVMGESIAIGIIGAAVGVGLGCGGAAVITGLAPRLSETVGSAAAASGSGQLGAALRNLTATTHTVSVTLTAPVTLTVVGLAVTLAIIGGVVAGSLGGWRAARMRPAAALTRVD